MNVADQLSYVTQATICKVCVKWLAVPCLIISGIVQEKEVVKREKAISKDAAAVAKQVNEVSKRNADLNALEARVSSFQASWPYHVLGKVFSQLWHSHPVPLLCPCS